MRDKKYSNNNELLTCLKNGQIREASQKQRKFLDAQKLSSDLSTCLVDMLKLAPISVLLQQNTRISA
ncbi:MAG TPA: hypothetical protein DC031_07125 [Sulfitobacter sp.]|nr:hypothetical protein [Sulfitobacter sp.]HBB83037.1 hypothetical protein [Sulfitobacter sp.]